MQFFNLLLLFNLFQVIIGSNSSPRMNYNHGLRNLGFKVVIFKEKKYPKITEYIKRKYKIYYEKAMASITEGVIEYENLSYEDKEMIDIMISTLFS
jgi:hypothetical protein